MKHTKSILFCNCGAGLIAPQRAAELSAELRKLEADVVELHDLCAFSVHDAPKLGNLTAGYEQTTIIACFPRAVKNMLQQGGARLGEFDVLNFRTLNNEAIISELKSRFSIPEGESNYLVEKTDLEVPAWYPVIDQSRCISCGQCARFCLFGVYRFDKKNLEVVHPLNCKNNCPACGRTCPTQAIIFPRLPENSVLSGAEPLEKDKTIAEKQSSLFVMLNERNKSRQSIFRQGVMQLAEEERQKALEEVRKMNQKEE
ncbi:ATP-binding protein [Mangrovibacterium diazotrophicum]|uniref:4Fe-4S binding protein n=1 Tax=Mangrovibacterium diazotrophicum TaxID=1261403 RepID=A0A419VX34_9BACT|nr:ferredoxin family protein [Mangrovibacterium diazotrophicum]RKD87795.1 4Fe-4S binding protein [Mangrovibacterium diazotrophicum]